MLVYTTKLSKRKFVIGIIAAAVILCAIIAAVSLTDGDNGAQETIAGAVKNNKQRIEYLESYGWQVSESAIEEQDIRIPETFDGAYAQYNDLQLQQGFDLKEYCGKDCVRYTYEVLNYPDYPGTVVADMVVFKNHVIAGDIQATSLDGFMHGFAYPDETKDTLAEDVVADLPTDIAEGAEDIADRVTDGAQGLTNNVENLTGLAEKAPTGTGVTGK